MKHNSITRKMSVLVAMMLSAQMAVVPAHGGVQTSKSLNKLAHVKREKSKRQTVTNMVIKAIRFEAEQDKERLFSNEMKSPENRHNLANKEFVLTEIQKVIQKLENKEVDLGQVKSDLYEQIQAEEQMHLVQLRVLLAKMDIAQVQRIFSKSMSKGRYPKMLMNRFEAAYSRDEKIAVLTNMVQHDLSLVKSQTMKKIGLLDREGLIKELKSTKTLLTIKGKDTWWIVALVVVTVVAAGLSSWAIISATKKRYEKKLEKEKKKIDRELDERLADERERLENELADQNRKLDEITAEYELLSAEVRAEFEERARLREQGFVWTICSQRTITKSASCSYDGSTHSGSEVCLTRCLKNPNTGAETMHEESCSSAYIPSNCSVANPYVSGYNSGYNSGYDEGYTEGFDRVYREAYDEFYRRGYDDGYVSGYDEGYNIGFSDGWAQAEYDDEPEEVYEEEDDYYEEEDDYYEDDDYYDDEDDYYDDEDDYYDDEDDYYGDDDWFDDDDSLFDDDDDWFDDTWRRKFLDGLNNKSGDSTILNGFKHGYREGYALATKLRSGLLD